MITITNTHKWRFETPCENVTKSLNDKLKEYSKDKFAIIVLDSRDIGSIGCCATFSFNAFMGAGLNKRIDIGNCAKYDEEKYIISFDNIEDAFFMQHELNHFVHLCVDNGKYIHPNLKGKVFDTKSFRNGLEIEYVKGINNYEKANEIEVGYRCLMDDINYGVPKDIALIDKHIQKINLFNFEDWKKYASKEIIDKFNDMDKDGKKRFLDNLCEQISILSIKPDQDSKFNVVL